MVIITFAVLVLTTLFSILWQLLPTKILQISDGAFISMFDIQTLALTNDL